MQTKDILHITQKQFENLQKLPELIRAIPPEKFDMATYRAEYNDSTSLNCNSVGCVIGHTIGNFPDAIVYDSFAYKKIDFGESSENAFGFDMNSDNWLFLFSWEWGIRKESNIPEQAARRVELLLKNCLVPNNWKFNSIY